MNTEKRETVQKLTEHKTDAGTARLHKELENAMNNNALRVKQQGVQLVDKVCRLDSLLCKRCIKINNGGSGPLKMGHFPCDSFAGISPYLPEKERKERDFALCGARLRALP